MEPVRLTIAILVPDAAAAGFDTLGAQGAMTLEEVLIGDGPRSHDNVREGFTSGVGQEGRFRTSPFVSPFAPAGQAEGRLLESADFPGVLLVRPPTTREPSTAEWELFGRLADTVFAAASDLERAVGFVDRLAAVNGGAWSREELSSLSLRLAGLIAREAERAMETASPRSALALLTQAMDYLDRYEGEQSDLVQVVLGEWTERAGQWSQWMEALEAVPEARRQAAELGDVDGDFNFREASDPVLDAAVALIHALNQMTADGYGTLAAHIVRYHGAELLDDADIRAVVARGKEDPLAEWLLAESQRLRSQAYDHMFVVPPASPFAEDGHPIYEPAHLRLQRDVASLQAALRLAPEGSAEIFAAYEDLGLISSAHLQVRRLAGLLRSLEGLRDLPTPLDQAQRLREVFRTLEETRSGLPRLFSPQRVPAYLKSIGQAFAARIEREKRRLLRSLRNEAQLQIAQGLFEAGRDIEERKWPDAAGVSQGLWVTGIAEGMAGLMAWLGDRDGQELAQEIEAHHTDPALQLLRGLAVFFGAPGIA